VRVLVHGGMVVHAHELVGAHGGDGGLVLRFGGDRREGRGECRQQQRVGVALDAPRLDTRPPRQCMTARWHAWPGAIGHRAQAEMAIRFAIRA
jgi:hypothetical protein